ncbi:MAG: hypothetical protein ACHQ6U_13415 [Thermodesulfobacteriota bacterium]
MAESWGISENYWGIVRVGWSRSYEILSPTPTPSTLKGEGIKKKEGIETIGKGQSKRLRRGR